MLNLLKKEFLLQKNTIFFIVVYIFLAEFFMGNFSGSLLIYIVCMTTSFFLVLAAYKYDEKNKSNYIINSLPVKRKEIVFVRYISLIIYSALSIGITLLFGFVFHLFGYNNLFLSNISPFLICTVFIINILFASILFPIFFKFGYSKANIISTFLYFIFFFTSISLGVKGNTEIIKFFASINISAALFMLIGFLTISLIFILSMLLSIKLYDKIDFWYMFKKGVIKWKHFLKKISS